MPNEIQTKLDSWANFTITLASLAASGGSRQSTIVSNTNQRPAALILLRISPGTAPTAGGVYEMFMIRGDDSGNRTDLAGASDAAITISNAALLGTLVNSGVTTDQEDIFDTAPIGPLGTEFGIAVRNSTDQALDGTEANHLKRHALYLPEIQ